MVSEKLKDRAVRFSASIRTYGFAIYSSMAGIITGIETIICSTVLFTLLTCVFVVDIVLVLIGTFIDRLLNILGR